MRRRSLIMLESDKWEPSNVEQMVEGMTPAGRTAIELGAHGEHTTLACGCTYPPGCSCDGEAMEIGARVQAMLRECTGLTDAEIFAIRDESRRRGDPAYALKVFLKIAQDRGTPFVLVRPK